jgi:hypothetical protein
MHYVDEGMRHMRTMFVRFTFRILIFVTRIEWVA